VRRVWTQDEVRILTKGYADNKVSIPDLAKTLNRSENTVKCKASNLGLKKVGVVREDLDVIHRLLTIGGSNRARILEVLETHGPQTIEGILSHYRADYKRTLNYKTLSAELQELRALGAITNPNWGRWVADAEVLRLARKFGVK
jgi:hypothetical protein